ncbi:MAG TPA: M23 family metallopeptidase [Stellaceae bacterium]|nr:M23 family metallopeptidase [Stellaceae bacterium]
MGEQRCARLGIVRAAATIAFTGLVAACSTDPPSPAPVILRGAAPGFASEAAIMPASNAARMARPMPPGRTIVAQHGQSVGRIAQEHRVPTAAIIAANHLSPPYKIETGQRLLIPAGSDPTPTAIPAGPAPGPPTAVARATPDIIPLDGPAPPAAIEPAAIARPPQGPASLTPPLGSTAPPKPPAEPDAAEEARAEPGAAAPKASGTPRGGRFPWPVRGRVLAGYGVAAGGGHNDGINIAAPRGASVSAIDGGVVAYAGNELRGYGNLVLVKHADGWISAYAHCEELLVKHGDTVRRGQVIAKVGATGGVSEPQLHFELRRGKKAVDPREFLAPAPTAGAAEPERRG